jgi:hypothetical protein
MSILKFVAIAGAGIVLGDKLHTMVQDKFPNTFGPSEGPPTTTQLYLGYGVVAVGVAGALLAAHAIFRKRG